MSIPSANPVLFWKKIVEIVARVMLLLTHFSAIILVILLIVFATNLASAAEDLYDLLEEAAEKSQEAAADFVDYQLDYDVLEKSRKAMRTAAGIAIFVGVLILIIEILFIICHFLNFKFLIAYKTIFRIVDIVYHILCALLLLAAAICLAYFAGYARNLADDVSTVAQHLDKANVDDRTDYDNTATPPVTGPGMTTAATPPGPPSPDIVPDIDIDQGVQFVVDILNRIGNTLGIAAFLAFVSLLTFIFVSVWSILHIVFKWDRRGTKKSAAATSSSSSASKSHAAIKVNLRGSEENLSSPSSAIASKSHVVIKMNLHGGEKSSPPSNSKSQKPKA